MKQSSHTDANKSTTVSRSSNDQGKTSFIQAKTEVSSGKDKYEKEADDMAAFVGDQSGGPQEVSASPPTIQKMSEEEKIQKYTDESEPDGLIQGDTGANSISPAMQNNLNSSKSKGSSLPPSTNKKMSNAFGKDMGHAKMHNDSNAHSMNRKIGSQAFAHGNHVYFNKDRYQPGTKKGDKLIAHELTHTVQQGGSGNSNIQKSEDDNSSPDANIASPLATIYNLNSPTLEMTDEALEGISTRSDGSQIGVRFGQLGNGQIFVKKNRAGEISTKNNQQYIPVVLAGLPQLPGVTPVIKITIRNNEVSGYVTAVKGQRLVRGSNKGLVEQLKEHSTVLGWAGIDLGSIPEVTNEISNGNLRLSVSNIPVNLGGFVRGSLDLGLTNTDFNFSANANINIPNLEPTQINVAKDEEGNVSGHAELTVGIANFSGAIHADFLNGNFNIEGDVGYETEKMSGRVHLIVTDAATARNVALNQLNPEQVDQSAREANGIPEANSQPVSGPRALAGWGEIDFRFTDWMTGKAKVIIDNEGHVTIQGEIAPPAEVELFAQRDYIYNIFTVEVRTLYGVPLVGNVFLFANIGMDALAKIGPAKIYDIVAEGTYSTDPAIFNSFSLSASFNMSMFAGLRLRAEGGLGVELLGHDIKVGVGINALAGIRGYVDARPTIGYRESSDPVEGRQGDFYIKGHSEIAAQPFLGLGGDLFVELDSPWWSPAPDKKWTWPLGELEYPLPGEMGMGVDFDYVIGSDELPTVTPGEVDFNSDKFMTDLMNDHVPPASNTDEDQIAEFDENPTGEGGSTQPQLTDSTGNPNGDQPARGQQDGPTAAPPTPEVLGRWGQGLEALRALATTAEDHPFSRSQITAQLRTIKNRFGFTELNSRLRGGVWHIAAAMPNIDNGSSPLTIKADSAAAQEEANEEQNTERVELGDAEVGEVIRFNAGDESHRLWISVDGGRVEVMVASTPTTFISKLNQWEASIPSLSEANKTIARTLINRARSQYNITLSEAREAKTEIDQAKSEGTVESVSEAQRADNEVESSQQILKRTLTELFNLFTGENAEVELESPEQINAERIRAHIGHEFLDAQGVLKNRTLKTELESIGYQIYSSDGKDRIRRRSGTTETHIQVHFDGEGKLQEGGVAGQSTSTHREFVPADITVTEENGIYIAKYGTVRGPDGETLQSFEVAISFNEIEDEALKVARNQNVQGEGLQVKRFQGRGVWDSANRGFHNAHLIADRFGGSGQNQAMNIYPSSPHYNVSMMKGIEDSIASTIGRNIDFAMRVHAQIMELRTSNLQSILQEEVHEDQDQTYINSNNQSEIDAQEGKAISKLRIPIVKDVNAVPGQFARVEYIINNESVGSIGEDPHYDDLIAPLTTQN